MLILVPELNNMETQTVYVEVNVPLLEIRGHRFPHSDFWMHGFYGFPCCLTYALAVCLWMNEQDFQFASSILLVNLKNQTPNHIAITDNAIGFGLIIIDATLNGLSRNDLFAFF